MNRLAPFAFALVVVLTAVRFTPAAAQSTWLDTERRPSVLVETLFPNFDDSDTDFPTWTWFASTRLPLGKSKTTTFVAEVPYAHGQSGDSGDGSVGNVYVGIEYAPRPSGLRLEFGTRLPLMSDEGLFPFVTGYYTDVEREEAFVPDQMPLRLGLHYHAAPGATTHIAYDVRVTPSAWIKINDKFLNETELFLGYGAWMRYEGEEVRVGGGLTGRWNTSNDGEDFGEASVHQLDLGADFLRGAVRPGLQFKLPLDNGLQSAIDSVVGVTLTVLPGR